MYGVHILSLVEWLAVCLGTACLNVTGSPAADMDCRLDSAGSTAESNR